MMGACPTPLALIRWGITASGFGHKAHTQIAHIHHMKHCWETIRPMQGMGTSSGIPYRTQGVARLDFGVQV